MILSGPLYDKLKFLAQILLPAMGALYFGLAQIWGLPKAEEIVGSIAVIDTFLGVLLGISASKYNEAAGVVLGGEMVPQPTDDGLRWHLILDNPEKLTEAREVRFLVRQVGEARV